MTHVAFDLGLARTGFAWADGVKVLTCPARRDGRPLRGPMRLQWWRRELRNELDPMKCDGLVVLIEGPFMHPGHPTGAIETIKLHGVANVVAADARARVIEVPPSTLKKASCGRGNATKAQMMAAARESGWDGEGDDSADAFLLHAYWARREHNRGVSAPLISGALTP